MDDLKHLVERLTYSDYLERDLLFRDLLFRDLQLRDML